MKRSIPILLAIVLFAAPVSQAGQFLGGKGYLHTNTARLLPPGAVDVSLYIRGYADPFSDLGYTLIDGTSALATSFGFSRHMELGFTQIIYQDLNATRVNSGETASALIPGDTYIRFKFADFSVTERIYLGFLPTMRYRTARYHDVHLEPYSSGGVEADLEFLASYYKKPLYPDECVSVHLNLGYLNHNDQSSVLDAAQEVHFLLGAIRPRERIDYGCELYGSFFIRRPSERTLSREDWMYVTPFIRYKLFKGLHLSVGLDVLLLGRENTTIDKKRNFSQYPNYPGWRLSTKISIIPSTSFYAAPTFVKPEEAATGRVKRAYDRTSGDPMEFFNRKALFKWAIEERTGQVEAIDLDLEKIRRERKKAEEELQRLKRELEAKRRKSAG